MLLLIIILFLAETPTFCHMMDADKELEYTSRQFYWLKKHFLRRLKESGILEDILTPIGDNSTEKGYFRAMMGLNELDVDHFESGCIEEISQKGAHWIECQILMAYLHTNGVARPSVCSKDAEILRSIARDKETPAKLYNSLQLCLANLIMKLHMHELDNAVETELLGGTPQQKFWQEAVNELVKIEKFCAQEKIYIIKSGVLIDGITTEPNDKFMRNLKLLCKLMPNFSFAHFQLHFRDCKSLSSSSSMSNVSALIDRQKGLCERFPYSMDLRGNYIIFLATQPNGTVAALRELEQFRRENPDRVDDTWWYQGSLNEGKPISVAFYKRAIKQSPSQLELHEYLYNYFASTTYEYGKALEILNLGLDYASDKGFFGDLFKWRQELLQRIDEQNFWDKLYD